MTEFEKCLRFGRKKKKLTQRDLADQTGLSMKDVSMLESGLFVPLQESTLCRIAQIVGTDEALFLSMYRSLFLKELKQLQSKTEALPESPSKNNPELTELFNTLSSMPEEPKTCIIQTIRMLIRAQEVCSGTT